MSTRVVVWAFDQRVESSAAKLVLVKLADNANDDGMCWPSHAYLSKHCELSKASIKRHVAYLASRNLVEVIPRFKDGVALTNAYRILVDGGGVNPDRGGVTSEPRVGSQVSYRTVIEPKNTLSPRANAMPEDGWSLDQVLEAANHPGVSVDAGMARAYFDNRTAAGWVDGAKREVARTLSGLQADLRKWRANESRHEKPGKKGLVNTWHQEKPDTDMRKAF